MIASQKVLSDSYFLGDNHRYYPEISKGIYKGFVPKVALEKYPMIRKSWNDKVDKLKRTLMEDSKIEHDINFRIYRSWEDLEDYHVQGIRALKKKVEGEAK